MQQIIIVNQNEFITIKGFLIPFALIKYTDTDSGLKTRWRLDWCQSGRGENTKEQTNKVDKTYHLLFESGRAQQNTTSSLFAIDPQYHSITINILVSNESKLVNITAKMGCKHIVSAVTADYGSLFCMDTGRRGVEGVTLLARGFNCNAELTKQTHH